MKLRLCSIVGALLSFTGFGAAPEQIEVPLVICIKQSIRERPESASPEMIRALQQNGQLPASIAEIKRVILQSDYRIWGALSVKAGDPQNAQATPTGNKIYPNHIETKQAPQIVGRSRRGFRFPVKDIILLQNGSIDTCDGFVQRIGHESSVALVFRAHIDRTAHQQLARTLKQQAPWGDYPKVFNDIRAQAASDCFKLSSSIKLGNDQCFVDIPYISLAYFAAKLAGWTKNLLCTEQPVLPGVKDSELIIPPWSDLRSLEKELLSTIAFIEGQKCFLRYWYPETRSVAVTNLSIDLFEQQAQVLNKFIQNCGTLDTDPAIERRKREATQCLFDLECSIIPKLKKTLEVRQKNLSQQSAEIKNQLCTETLEQLKIKQVAINQEIERLKQYLLGPSGPVQRRNEYLSIIARAPGQLAAFERYRENGAGWVNRLLNLFNERPEEVISCEYKFACLDIYTQEEAILCKEAQLESKLLIKDHIDQAVAQVAQSTTSSINIQQGPIITSDGYLVRDNSPLTVSRDERERQQQEKEYEKQRAHIEDLWVKLSECKARGPLEDFYISRLEAIEKTMQTNGARSLVEFNTTAEFEEMLVSMNVNVRKYKNATLNDYQIHLALEQSEILNCAFKLKRDIDLNRQFDQIAPIIKEMCNDAMHMALIADDCNRLIMIKQSELFIEAARKSLQIALLPVQGSVRGIERLVIDYCPRIARAFFNPVGAVVDTATWLKDAAIDMGHILFTISQINDPQLAIFLAAITGDQQPIHDFHARQIAVAGHIGRILKNEYNYIRGNSIEQTISTIFENITYYSVDCLILHNLSEFFLNTASKARTLVNSLRTTRNAAQVEEAIATTAEGLRVKIAHEFLEESKNIVKLAEELHCPPNSTFTNSLLKHYLETGKKIENRIEAMIDVDHKIIFRKDFGSQAHPLPSRFGFPPGMDIDHYNVEFAVREHLGTTIDGWHHQVNLHIVTNNEGQITHYFITRN